MASRGPPQNGPNPFAYHSHSHKSFAIDLKPKSHSLLGRTARDLDEELVKLRNENFNLKLRLYFKDNGGDHTKNKELEDAKTVIHALRMEVLEKTQLLQEAADAMTEHEDREKEFVRDSQAKIAQLESCIAQMKEAPLETLFTRESHKIKETPSPSELVKRKMDDLHDSQLEVEQLTQQLTERDREMYRQMDELQQSKKEIEQIKQELAERDREVQRQMDELHKTKLEIDLLKQHLTDREKELHRQMDEAHKAKHELELKNKEVATLKKQLSERDIKQLISAEKMQDLITENSELKTSLREQRKIANKAKQLVTTREQELVNCLTEKQGLLVKLNELQPELIAQNEVVKEATVTIKNLLMSTDLNEQASRKLVMGYRAALNQSRAEIRNITASMEQFNSNYIPKGCPADSSSSSSSSSSSCSSCQMTPLDLSMHDLSSDATQTPQTPQTEDAQPVQPIEKCEPEPTSSQGGSGEHPRSSAKSRRPGLRQFVKCWGRPCPK
ncbi:centrosomin isoform X2 [Drosophila mojavensis]|uniref:Uncharacterized protein, isoform B n=1 Tax=Drosophila mojavensis TaxID=7230 RepID=A0A0Q9WYJ0_DROMO|nr:centrosomin isoform X2 [Drosophila mojavensis]KRF94099.1 uncharacterized protein Dmoj_GI15815, isoform B [Drosophila mojavensis]